MVLHPERVGGFVCLEMFAKTKTVRPNAKTSISDVGLNLPAAEELLVRHTVLLNPLHSVRGVRHPFGEGRTPEASVEPACRLLASCTQGRKSGPIVLIGDDRGLPKESVSLGRWRRSQDGGDRSEFVIGLCYRTS